MEQLVKNCGEHETKVFLISGSISETESTSIDPRFNKHMRDFLSNLQAKYDHVTVLTEGEELPRLKPSQYVDLLHLAEEYRPWYSRAVAQVLAKELEIDIRADAAPEAIVNE